MCSVTRSDRIKNKYRRGHLRVTNIAEMTRENRLKWFKHMSRDDEIRVDGNQKRGKLKKKDGGY